MKRKASASFEEKLEVAAEAAAESFRQNAAIRKAATDACNLAKIITELQAHPCKNENCLTAVMGSMFMPKEQKSRNDVTHFSDCNKWVFKVPQGHLKSYGSRRFNLSTGGLAEKITKKDPKCWHRITYRITGWDGMTPNTIFVKIAFDAELDKAKAKVEVLEEIPIADDGSIMWGLFGWFTMWPLLAEGADPNEHVFTKLECCGTFKVGRR